MRRRSRHAIQGVFADVAAGGVLPSGADGWVERAGVVPAVRDQSDGGLQVDRGLQGAGGRGSGRSLAPAVDESQPEPAGAGGPGPGGAAGASGLGRAQDPPGSAQPGRSQGAVGLDDHRDSAPAWPTRRSWRGPAARLGSLRARRTQRSLADGLQGLVRAGPGPLSSADGAGRPFALCAGDRGLRRRAGRERARPAGSKLPPLRPALAHPVRQRPALGHGRPRRATAGPIIRRPRARTSASTARSRPRCSTARPSRP